jgi:predicted phosphate transport protein (TIGR00153 family)
VLRRLLPKGPPFFELFSQHAALSVQGAQLLQELIAQPRDAEERAARIRSVEHEADLVCQRTIELLHSTFVTPIERGDIHQIASRLDDILDHIEATAHRIWLYEIAASPPEAIEMAAHLLEATRAMKATVDALARRPGPEHVRELSRAVKQVEKQNDRVLRRATARLFKQEQDPKTLIKWKEIYENIEEAIDRCEDVANVIEGVVLENA